MVAFVTLEGNGPRDRFAPAQNITSRRVGLRRATCMASESYPRGGHGATPFERERGQIAPSGFSFDPARVSPNTLSKRLDFGGLRRTRVRQAVN